MRQSSRAPTRWLATQGRAPGIGLFDRDGWLFAVHEMHAERVPGAGCLAALENDASGERAGNIARVRRRDAKRTCRLVVCAVGRGRITGIASRGTRSSGGALLAGLTHGHPTGRLAAGALAALVALIARRVADKRDRASRCCCGVIPTRGDAGRDDARGVPAGAGVPRRDGHRLGRRLGCRRALAIALLCALTAPDYELACGSRSTTMATATPPPRSPATCSVPCMASKPSPSG